MAKSKKGLRIGNYRITPLGVGTLIALLLIAVIVVALLVLQPFGEGGASLFAKPTPTPTPTPVVTPEPTPVPTPSPTPEPTPRSATIRSLGEIAIQKNLLEAAKTESGAYDFTEMFSEISDIMGDADLTVADVEGSLGGNADPSAGDLMVTPASLIDTLKACGVDMLNIANDHALDGNADGLFATLENCKAAGMEYIGAAASAEEKAQGKILTVNGINVGFVGYTESLNGLETKVDASATEYGVNLIKNSNAAKDIQNLKDQGAEVVIAYVSWGEMLKRETSETQQKIAKALVSAGADVIIGYNPHVIQPATWIEMKDASGNVTQRTLCLGAPGNFLSDSREQYSDSGIIFEFTIQEKEDFSGLEITSPTYIPTYVWRIENEDGGYDYRTLAVGQWLETAPEGMSYADSSRLKEVWAEAQSIMGQDVATVANG